MILMQRRDLVGGRALVPAKGSDDTAVMRLLQSVAGSQPEKPIAIFNHGEHAVGSPFRAKPVRHNVPGPEPAEPVGGSDPQTLVAPFVEGADGVRSDAVLAAVGKEFALAQAVESPGKGSDPEAAFAIFKGGAHLVAAQSVFFGEALMPVRAQPAQPAPVESDPKAALPVLTNRTDREGSELAIFIRRQPAGRESVNTMLGSSDPQPAAIVKTCSACVGDRAGELLPSAVLLVEPIDGSPGDGPERSVRRDRQTRDVAVF